jgi:hypothetical protein
VHFGLDTFRDAAPKGAAKLEDIKPAMVGDWWVLRVGSDLVEGLLKQLQDDDK